MKCPLPLGMGALGCRSREGAWLAIQNRSVNLVMLSVAPARERGLKFPGDTFTLNPVGRSREGAWIEISEP